MEFLSPCLGGDIEETLRNGDRPSSGAPIRTPCTFKLRLLVVFISTTGIISFCRCDNHDEVLASSQATEMITFEVFLLELF